MVYPVMQDVSHEFVVRTLPSGKKLLLHLEQIEQFSETHIFFAQLRNFIFRGDLR